LLKKHNAVELTKLFNEEEMLYIGKICRIKNIYDAKIKKGKREGRDVLSEFLSNSEDIKSTMGIDEDIIKNMDKIVIDKF